MGTVVWLKNIRIEVRTREKHHAGRPHCHAVLAEHECEASIDLATFEVLESTGYARSDIKSIIETVKKHHDLLMAKWREYHGQN